MAHDPHIHHAPEETLQEALGVLRENGYRITRPRKAILEALLQKGGPATIEDLHLGLTDGLCDLATVYRCLAAFEKLGLVRRSHFHDGTSLYELDMGPDHHHHIICTSCRKVEALDFCVVEGLERLIRERGYRNISHMLEFFGVCQDCATKEDAEKN